MKAWNENERGPLFIKRFLVTEGSLEAEEPLSV